MPYMYICDLSNLFCNSFQTFGEAMLEQQQYSAGAAITQVMAAVLLVGRALLSF